MYGMLYMSLHFISQDTMAGGGIIWPGQHAVKASKLELVKYAMSRWLHVTHSFYRGKCAFLYRVDPCRYCALQVNMPNNGQHVEIRIGLHTGPVVSGMVGAKLPKFSIFGVSMI